MRVSETEWNWSRSSASGWCSTVCGRGLKQPLQHLVFLPPSVCLSRTSYLSICMLHVWLFKYRRVHVFSLLSLQCEVQSLWFKCPTSVLQKFFLCEVSCAQKRSAKQSVDAQYFGVRWLTSVASLCLSSAKRLSAVLQLPVTDPGTVRLH